MFGKMKELFMRAMAGIGAMMNMGTQPAMKMKKVKGKNRKRRVTASLESWNKTNAIRSKAIPFPDSAKLENGKHEWCMKNGSLERRAS